MRGAVAIRGRSRKPISGMHKAVRTSQAGTRDTAGRESSEPDALEYMTLNKYEKQWLIMIVASTLIAVMLVLTYAGLFHFFSSYRVKEIETNKELRP